jgi:limonene 1,2-monooxygenase
MMEMAVAANRSPVGALAAGRHGIGMLSIGGTSDDALKAHANNWRLYEESARAAGNTPDRRNWRIVTFAHIAETREQAHADVKFGLENFKRYFFEVATFPIIPPDVTGDPAEYLVSTGLACIGTPEDCVRHFERLWKGSDGGLGGILLLAHNWADWVATKRSYELMARYVHPHFQRDANALRQWSYDDAKSKYETAGDASRAAVQAAIDKYQLAPADFTSPFTPQPRAIPPFAGQPPLFVRSGAQGPQSVFSRSGSANIPLHHASPIRPRCSRRRHL